MPDIILTWMNRASRILPNEKFGPEVVVGRLGGYYKMKNYSKCDYLIANTQDIKNYIIDSGGILIRSHLYLTLLIQIKN